VLWVAADGDLLAVARDLSWWRRSALLPPWPADSSGAHVGAGSPSPPVEVRRRGGSLSVAGAADALVARYGRLRHSLRQLRHLQWRRARQLAAMDATQRARASAPPDQKLLSAYELLLLGSSEEQDRHAAAIDRGLELARRLRASQALEPQLWAWLATRVEAGGSPPAASPRRPPSSPHRRTSELREQLTCFLSEVEGQWAALFPSGQPAQTPLTRSTRPRGVPQQSMSPALLHELLGIQSEVDNEVKALLDRARLQGSAQHAGDPRGGRARTDASLATLAQSLSELQSKHSSVLQKSLGLCLSHLPEGVEPRQFRTSKARARNSLR